MAAMAAPSLEPPGHPMLGKSLYVGDLDPKVTEMDLNAAFCKVGRIASLRLCRCATSGKSLRSGYVNFFSNCEASIALGRLNHTYLKGKRMRLMWSQRDPHARKSGIGNLFVKNLDTSINSVHLQSMFSKFGTVLSCKVAEENGQSKGFGFVQFDSEDSAVAARTVLHETMVEGKKLYVSKFVKKSERPAAVSCEESKFTSVYVRNLAENITEDVLRDVFSAYGNVCNSVIMKDWDGKSRGFGFVNFQSPENARNAVAALNGSLLGSKILFVGRALTKVERARLFKDECSRAVNCHLQKLKASNLYVKNLNIGIDDNKLRELFTPFGRIMSAKVMCYHGGTSRGFGFVRFSSPEEAKTAINALNGTRFKGKILYVAIAQSKKDRYLEQQKSSVQYLIQPSYPTSSNILHPWILPLYSNLTSFPLPFPYLHHPISYQHFGAQLDIRCPFATEMYQQNFSSYIPAGQSQTGWTRNTRDWSDGQSQVSYSVYNVHNQDRNHQYTGSKKLVCRKKGNKRDNAAESTSSGSQINICLPVIKSPSDSGKVLEDLLHPFVEKFQPESADKIKRTLLETSKCDIIELLNSPTSLALQVDRAVHLLKEANALPSADGASVVDGNTNS